MRLCGRFGFVCYVRVLHVFSVRVIDACCLLLVEGSFPCVCVVCVHLCVLISMCYMMLYGLCVCCVYVVCVVYVVCGLIVLYCVMLYGLLLCVNVLVVCGLHVCCL